MRYPARLLATVAVIGALYAARPADAAYFSQGEFAAAIAANNSLLGALPIATSVTFTDNRGSYTLTDDGGVSGRWLYQREAVSTASTLGAYLGCEAFSATCVGAHTITFQFAEEISGLTGNLRYAYGPGPGQVASIPQFGIPAPTTYEEVSAFYDGFWASTFEPTDTFTLTWPAGFRNADAYSYFTLSDAQAVRAPRFGGVGPGNGNGNGGNGNGNGNGRPVSVPEPASLALFGAALVGLAMARRRRRPVAV